MNRKAHSSFVVFTNDRGAVYPLGRKPQHKLKTAEAKICLNNIYQKKNGAICTICEKHIQYRLTRHNRISQVSVHKNAATSGCNSSGKRRCSLPLSPLLAFYIRCCFVCDYRCLAAPPRLDCRGHWEVPRLLTGQPPRLSLSL